MHTRKVVKRIVLTPGKPFLEMQSCAGQVETFFRHLLPLKLFREHWVLILIHSNHCWRDTDFFKRKRHPFLIMRFGGSLTFSLENVSSGFFLYWTKKSWVCTPRSYEYLFSVIEIKLKSHFARDRAFSPK